MCSNGQQLLKRNLAVVVDVNVGENFTQLLLRQIGVKFVQHSVLELDERDTAIFVGVQLVKELSHSFNVVLVHLLREHIADRHFKLGRGMKFLQRIAHNGRHRFLRRVFKLAHKHRRQTLFRRPSFAYVHLQHLAQHIATMTTHRNRFREPRAKTFLDDRIKALLDLHLQRRVLVQSNIAIVDVERRETKQHTKCNHTHAPNVGAFAIVAIEYLGCHIVWSSDAILQLRQSRHDSRHTKVDKFYRRILVFTGKQYIVGFEIQMKDVLAMHMIKRFQYLFENTNCFFLRK
mmetsp:Transcript_59687/g.98514  ORF Transcript_59687/g.98514 Transcript_59687/m.98514 type:complete len:289 (-) Transcript_59687:501-1367(-)